MIARPIRSLPSAVHRSQEITRRIGGRVPIVCLDYDGTLSPITGRAEDAVLPAATRRSLERLARVAPVAVISGRNVEEVRERVALPGIHYAGNHGFELLEPDGTCHRRGEAHLPALARAGRALEREVRSIPGARVEHKRFAIAVHHREVSDPSHADRLAELVRKLAESDSRLRATGGKKVMELRPAISWDKGKAVLRIVELLGLWRAGVVVYVGDDLTDEDAFLAIAGQGIGIVVRGEDDDRTTCASYSLPGPDEVRTFLEELAVTVSSDRGAALPEIARAPARARAPRQRHRRRPAP